ncbi:multidrug ABC transporter ATP-binding protein [Pseudomonas sp. FFUP_PS_473]|uniref:ABC transporter ATP-binding protein n=1 Tax=Pseudomonas sp. FFUP_PS_473 TaxID=2060418 RepID=UPI000C7D4FC0|nr:ABC transporter ATP-binding protein [Pseudomonas sp. FFUP_PS_473]PLP89591.1 multidrug ABC transporter ATP-binding protein [Pseudomonas sp. FFUP_PS_473]
MLYRRFEQLIDIFRDAPTAAPPGKVLPFYLYYLRQVWPSFAVLLVVGLIGALIEVALFSYLSRIIDLAQGTPNVNFFSEHASELIWMLVVALILRPIFVGLHDLLEHQTISPGMTSMIRWQNHAYVLKQSLNFFQNDFAGRIAQRIMQTGNSLRDSAVQAVDALWHVLIYALSSLVLFAEADWRLMLPLITWITCYVGALFYFVPRVKARAVISSDARSKLMGRIVDGYTNIATLKLFAHTDFEQQYAREAIREQTEKTQLASRVITSMDVVITSLNGLLIVTTTALALWLWTQSLISVGAIALATGLVIRIVNMSGWIMWVVNGIFENIGMVQDGLQTIAQPVSVTDQPNAPALNVSHGAVRFEHVDFHYGKGSRIIEDLNLDIRPGEKIGLIGPSGAGKSTLVNLLLRLYDLEGGRILIDGQDIATITQESLRAQIGMITQDTSLLHRSIRDNLLYGKPDATDDELWEAVRRARADEFIPQLSDAQGRTGFDAHVGERGVKLSGGQRQRIAIARVLLKNAPILIMDEATSALDSEVEAAIQDSLETLMRGKTVIAIAHRLSTIARMDRLVVLEKGRIAEMGSHAELLAHQGLYARLWQHQTGGFVGID